MRPDAPRHRWTRPAAYALTYAIGAMAWIVLSDLLVSALDAETTLVNIVKGFGFIVATSLLLYALLRRHEVRVGQADERARDVVRELIDQSTDVFHMVDLEGRFLLANRRVGEILGIDPQDAIGRRREDLIAGAVRTDNTPTDADVLAAGEPVVYLQDVGDEASRRHFRSTRFPIRSSTGKVVAIGTIAVDVTDEEAAQRKLAASEAAYRMMFDACPLPVWIHDEDTLELLAANGAALDLYGYDLDRFLRLRLTDLSPATAVTGPEPPPEIGSLGTFTTHVDSRGRLLDVELDRVSASFEGRPAVVVLTRDVTAHLQASARDQLLLTVPGLYEASAGDAFLRHIGERLLRLTRSTGGRLGIGGGAAQVTVGEPETADARHLVVRAGEGSEPLATLTLWGKPFEYAPADELGCRLVLQQMQRVVERERFVHDLEVAAHQHELTIKGVARTLGAIVDTRDPYTAGHQQRVGELAAMIGLRLGLPESDVAGLRIGGYLHDIGKIATPFALLTRPGPLDAADRLVVERHSRTGRDLLVPVPFPWPIAQMVDQHHERLDGSGYPAGLAGDAIIPEARIIAVADVFDAITSTRPYRPGSDIDVALDELRRGAGVVYDAAAVDALIAHVREAGPPATRTPVEPG